MASAWLISVCFIKFNERTAKFIEKTSTDSFTVNRAIQKICDSYRVDFTVKENIKKLKRKI